MATRHSQSALGLDSLDTDFGLGSSGSLVPYQPGHALTRQQQRIGEEGRTQELVIELTARKTVFAMGKIGEIHQHGASTFNSGVGFILEVKSRVSSREQQVYSDAFSTRQIEQMAKQLQAIIGVSAAGIGAEVHRTLYVDPEPLSLRQRIFG